MQSLSCTLMAIDHICLSLFTNHEVNWTSVANFAHFTCRLVRRTWAPGQLDQLPASQWLWNESPNTDSNCCIQRVGVILLVRAFSPFFFFCFVYAFFLFDFVCMLLCVCVFCFSFFALAEVSTWYNYENKATVLSLASSVVLLRRL